MTPQGRAYAKRNRGTLNAVLNPESNQNFVSPRPEPRIPSRLGREVMEKSRGDEVKQLLDTKRCLETPPSRPPSRHRSRDVNSASTPRCNSVYLSMDSPVNRSYQSPRPQSRGKADSREKKEKNKEAMDSPVNRNYQSPRPQSRGKADSREKIEKNKEAMAKMMGDNGYRAFVYSDGPPSARIKPEAKDNAERGKGEVYGLISKYGTFPRCSRPRPRVSGAAIEIAQTNKGSLHILFHDYGKHPPSPAPSARVRPEAEANAKRNRGTMETVLRPNSEN